MTELSTAQALRNLSAQDFMQVGKGQIGYVRPVQAEGQNKFAVHMADGQLLFVQETPAAAIVNARRNGIEILQLH